jgi:hypothetical protein
MVACQHEGIKENLSLNGATGAQMPLRQQVYQKSRDPGYVLGEY